MIIAVLALGGAILGATTLAGLLVLYDVRSTTDFVNSAKSIFAADSGVNWALYSYYDPPATALPVLPSGIGLVVTCYDKTNAVVTCDDPSTQTAISEGSSLNTRRAFFVNIAGATTTLP